MIWKIKSEFLTVRVSPYGGALLDVYDSKHRSILRPFCGEPDNPDILDTACFPLVPICNRVANSRFNFAGKDYHLPINSDEDTQYIHGDAWLAVWKLEKQTDREIALSYQHRADDSPYQYKVFQTISINKNTLSLDLKVTNLGEFTLPFGIGFHPYFPRTKNMTLKAKSNRWWIKGSNNIPIEKVRIPNEFNFSEARQIPNSLIDNCYENWDRRALIHYPENELTIELTTSVLFDRFMLYSPLEKQDYFCLEPMSHAPNAINLENLGGMQVLENGDSISAIIRLTVID